MRLHATIAALAVLVPTLGAAQYPPPPPSYPPPPPAYAPPPAPAYPQPYQQPYAQPAPQPHQAPPPLAGPSVNLWVGLSGVSDIYGTYGTVRLDGHEAAGISLEVPVHRMQTIELKWVVAKQTAQFESHTLAYPSTSKVDAVSQFYMIGSNTVIRRGKVDSFFGGSLGALLFQPGTYTAGGLTYNPVDSWAFTFGLGGGAKIHLSERVAIRIGMDVYFPVYSGSSSIYISGSGAYFSAWIPSVFGQLTAGVAFGG